MQGSWCLESRSYWGTCSDVGENAGECLDGGKLIVAQRCERGCSGMSEILGECTSGRGGGACGAAGWDGAIVRVKLHIFCDAFCGGTWNVDAVTSVVVGDGSKVTPINTIGVLGAAVARCFMDNDSGAGRC